MDTNGHEWTQFMKVFVISFQGEIITSYVGEYDNHMLCYILWTQMDTIVLNSISSGNITSYGGGRVRLGTQTSNWTRKYT